MRVTFNICSKKNNVGKAHMEGKKQGVHSYGINFLMFFLIWLYVATILIME